MLKQSAKTALGGISAALMLALMFLLSVFPSATIAAPAVASVVMLFAVLELGKGWSVGVYAATAILALLIIPSKEAAVLFAVFFGYYPIIKTDLDRMKSGTLRILAKFAVFAGAVTLLVLSLAFVIGVNDIREEMWLNIAFYTMMIGVLFLFDRAYASMAVLYRKRLRRILMRNNRPS